MIKLCSTTLGSEVLFTHVFFGPEYMSLSLINIISGIVKLFEWIFKKKGGGGGGSKPLVEDETPEKLNQ